MALLANADEARPGGDQSPTTIILNMLKAQGKPLTADNIRRVAIANARNTNQAGPDLIGGPVAGGYETVRNYDPTPSPGDPGTPQTRKPRSVAKKIEGPSKGPSISGDTAERNRAGGGGDPKTSAAPGDNTGMMVALGLPLGMGAAGAADFYRRMRDAGDPQANLRRYPTIDEGSERRGFQTPDSPTIGAVDPTSTAIDRAVNPAASAEAEFLGNNPIDPRGRTLNIDLPSIAPPTGSASGAIPTDPRIGGPNIQLPGPVSAPPTTDLEGAMQRAIAGPTGPTLGGEPLDLSGIRPPVSPTDVLGRPGLPTGVTDVDALKAGMGRGGMPQGAIAPPLQAAPAPTADVMPVRPPPVAMPPQGGGLAEMTAGRAPLLQALIDAARGGLRYGARR